MSCLGSEQYKLLCRLKKELGLEGGFARELLVSEWDQISAAAPFDEEAALVYLEMIAIERLWSVP